MRQKSCLHCDQLFTKRREWKLHLRKPELTLRTRVCTLEEGFANKPDEKRQLEALTNGLNATLLRLQSLERRVEQQHLIIQRRLQDTKLSPYPGAQQYRGKSSKAFKIAN
jgi:hypothetical protein